MASPMRSSSQHSKTGNDSLSKIGLLVALVVGAAFGFQKVGCNEVASTDNEPAAETSSTEMPAPSSVVSVGLPLNGKGVWVHHTYYDLSYREDHEQAEWVAYTLLKSRLNQPHSQRQDNFRPDPLVKTGSASLGDYRGSGFDRGHLCAAGDMSFDAKAQDETFFMSNISPQVGNFNKGIWRELEENVRDWARKYEKIHVVTGPVLAKKALGIIGKENDVSVPVSYYKVVLDLTGPEKKAIGYVIANDISDIPLSDFAVSVDEVERITGLDFFKGLITAEEELAVERQKNPDKWPIDAKRYQKRVSDWNKQE